MRGHLDHLVVCRTHQLIRGQDPVIGAHHLHEEVLLGAGIGELRSIALHPGPSFACPGTPEVVEGVVDAEVQEGETRVLGLLLDGAELDRLGLQLCHVPSLQIHPRQSGASGHVDLFPGDPYLVGGGPQPLAGRGCLLQALLQGESLCMRPPCSRERQQCQ